DMTAPPVLVTVAMKVLTASHPGEKIHYSPMEWMTMKRILAAFDVLALFETVYHSSLHQKVMLSPMINIMQR
ncbi:hypothetical protein U2060_14905, partial [Listeria monocytogenes]|uniref:hypothetical protein n=1 Tax=Listeria monocytogenes TaxID=1639 RepID=UPI002FDBA0BB